MKYLITISLGIVLGLLTTGCVMDAQKLSPDCLKLTTGMGWEMQAGCNTKKKPSVMVTADWKLK